jgi:hypothetical protein
VGPTNQPIFTEKFRKFKMPVTPSPLRYPGGKTIYAEMLMSVIDSNDLSNCTFVEAFAGGAGAAITLLLSRKVKSIF